MSVTLPAAPAITHPTSDTPSPRPAGPAGPVQDDGTSPRRPLWQRWQIVGSAGVLVAAGVTAALIVSAPSADTPHPRVDTGGTFIGVTHAGVSGPDGATAASHFQGGRGDGAASVPAPAAPASRHLHDQDLLRP